MTYVMKGLVTIVSAVALIAGIASVAFAQGAEKGACRYVTIVRGVTTVKCEERKGTEETCKNKSATGGYRWCPGKTCEECEKLEEENKNADSKPQEIYKKR